MSGAAVVRQAAAADFQVFFGQMIAADVVEARGKPVALGMLVRRPSDDRVWLTLNVRDGVEGNGLHIVRAGRRLLTRAAEQGYAPIFTGCNLFEHPRGDHLLTLIGFHLTSEVSDGLRIYCWHPDPGELEDG